MLRSIAVSDKVHARVRQLARFGGFDENEVIRRLLDQLETDAAALPKTDPSVSQGSMASGGRYLPGRAARERGARVRLGSETIQVDSVRDLFETVLRFVSKNGKRDLVKTLLPFKTSSQRFLISEKPIHPNGKPFFVPVQVGGFYMEAHKSYRTAIADLEDFLGHVKIPFQYISG